MRRSSKAKSFSKISPTAAIHRGIMILNRRKRRLKTGFQEHYRQGLYYIYNIEQLCKYIDRIPVMSMFEECNLVNGSIFTGEKIGNIYENDTININIFFI